MLPSGARSVDAIGVHARGVLHEVAEVERVARESRVGGQRAADGLGQGGFGHGPPGLYPPVVGGEVGLFLRVAVPDGH